MKDALALAARGIGRTNPNPMVGAVVAARDGRVVGRGWHARVGAPHAEILALQEAGEERRGGTLYVTLEPCAHFGRTPPCAPAVVEAGIERVVAAVADPNPRVAGRGFGILREGGVKVEVGLLAREAVRLNEAYFRWMQSGRPFATLKAAASLDGRTALRTGESRWITGPESRARVHQLRDRVDAIIVGVETVIHDDPLLTARPEDSEGKPLIRVVLDSHLRTPVGARTLSPDRGVATIVATTSEASEERRYLLEARGAEILRFPPGEGGRVPLEPLLEVLGKRGVCHALVEGGSRVHGAFIREALGDKIWVFLAPLIIGEEDAPGLVAGLRQARLGDVRRLQFMREERIGDDLLIEAYLQSPPWASFEEERVV